MWLDIELQRLFFPHRPPRPAPIPPSGTLMCPCLLLSILVRPPCRSNVPLPGTARQRGDEKESPIYFC